MVTQQIARNLLQRILRRPLDPIYDRCTGDATTCPIPECMVCAVRDCPANEPLHYHHDGCPSCNQ